MSIYAHDNDKKGLASVLEKYINFAEESGIDNDEQANLLSSVRHKIVELTN